ncbi:hypothetical protein L3X38_039029 [Prunus dulcis]|uniref:Fungal lipase-type domain-containing protein n=1 Tax=Prunus dulcis TaxID=3755 RepID=A0AAD4V8K4_PRUDU|nr:hypothetical protein L3X38_039029 [Prunus dulcis]
MACDKPFCNHLLLKPKDVGFSDLLHILFSKHLRRRRFCHSSEQTEHDLDEFCHSSEQTEHDLDEGRWLIFLSILVQKLLRFVAAPMAAIGWVIEMCLNIFSSKQNMVGLLQNFLRGKGMPGKSSRTFVSFIGHLDKRVELDRNIKFTDGNYNAALCMMASKISYENKFYIETTVQNQWKMEFLGSYDFWNDYQENATTQAFVLRDRSDDHDTIVVAFRGTEPFDADAWCSDFDISWYQLEGVGRIHGGFMKALARYIITGHSLGGALAILFPAVLTFHNGKDSDLLLKRLEGVYTFGQPRVGDKDFGRYMEEKMIEHKIKYFRSVYGNDIVPRLPYDDKALMFKHFGTCLYYNRQYEVQVLPEEPNKNYFSPMEAIPMMMNAFGELIRSFDIPYRLGLDYKEGPLLKMFRLMGLIGILTCLPLPPNHHL